MWGGAFVSALRDEGETLEAIYLDYLTGSARLLGVWWEIDRIGFGEVALASSRIYAILRSLEPATPVTGAGLNKTAIFASVPDEAHVLGVRMAADLFRHEGWAIDLAVGRSHEELVAKVRASDAQIIGLSASGARSLKALARLVLALRIEKPGLAIFVSGHVVGAHGDIVALMDIDGWAEGFEEANALISAWAEGVLGCDEDLGIE